MCGLIRAGGLKSSRITADARANRQTHIQNGKEQVSFNRPDTNLAKGWGYNAFSVPVPKKEDKKLKYGEDDDFDKSVMDENGNYPFSMPDASEVASGNITTPSNPRRKDKMGKSAVPMMAFL